jgi:hypothetical protein
MSITPMTAANNNKQHTLEIALVMVSVGLTCLLYQVSGYKMLVLNLYFLPVVLAAFFLGRYRAGVLSLFCVIAAFVVSLMDVPNFAAYTSPIVIALALTTWGAILALTTILVGTLSDERTRRLDELHEAHLGIVEVLSGYLSSADQNLRDRATRSAELCERVAIALKLSPDEIDDIRVAALLHGLDHVEVTAKVIRRALGDMGAGRTPMREHTFRGADLAQSLGGVLAGALPLLLDERSQEVEERNLLHKEIPFGAKIIGTVKAYVALVYGDAGQSRSPEEALGELRCDLDGNYHPAVIDALDRVILSASKNRRAPAEKVPVEV